LGKEFFVHHRIISAVERVEFVSDRVSYMALSSRRCNIIVLNVQASSEGKSEDLKDNFYEELEQVIFIFPSIIWKISLGDIIAKFGREDIFN